MTKKQSDRQIAAMQEYFKTAFDTPEKLNKFLYSTGFYTEDGELLPEYANVDELSIVEKLNRS